MHFSFTIVFHSNCNFLDGWTQILWFADTDSCPIPKHTWPLTLQYSM